MRNITENVARQLCGYLNEKGIKTESDFVLRSIDKTLRGSWYVDKVKQCGHTDCIHIEIDDENYHCFFVVCEDGTIMTGGNIFIWDAFRTFDETSGFFLLTHSEYKIYYTDDDVCILTSLKGVKMFFDRLYKSVLKATESRRKGVK